MTDALVKDTPPVPSAIPWYKSKTIWSALIGVVLGAIQPVSAALGHPIVVPTWVFELLAGMGLYSLRTANQEIK